jgi:hypothetical protein
MTDDLDWEPIPGVAGANGCPHPTRLLTPICSRKRGKARQVDGAVLVSARDPRLKLTQSQIRRARKLLADPATTVNDVAASLGVNRTTIYRALGLGNMGRGRHCPLRWTPIVRQSEPSLRCSPADFDVGSDRH